MRARLANTGEPSFIAGSPHETLAPRRADTDGKRRGRRGLDGPDAPLLRPRLGSGAGTGRAGLLPRAERFWLHLAPHPWSRPSSRPRPRPPWRWWLAYRDAAHHMSRARRLARDSGKRRLRLPHHRRRALLGRARLLRFRAGGDRTPDRDADRRDRRDVPRACRQGHRGRRISAATENPGDVLVADIGQLARRPAQPLWPARPLL